MHSLMSAHSTRQKKFVRSSGAVAGKTMRKVSTRVVVRPIMHQEITYEKTLHSTLHGVHRQRSKLFRSYKVTMQGTSSTGQDVSGTYNAASVWVKRDGKWLGVFHTEVKAQQP